MKFIFLYSTAIGINLILPDSQAILNPWILLLSALSTTIKKLEGLKPLLISILTIAILLQLFIVNCPPPGDIKGAGDCPPPGYIKGAGDCPLPGDMKGAGDCPPSGDVEVGLLSTSGLL